MLSHAQIIDRAGGPSKVGRAIAADPNTAKQWRRNDSIPAPYWEAMVKAEFATLDELAEAAAAKRRSPNSLPHGEAAA